MRSFKKAVLRVALFTLIFALICSPFVFLYLKKGSANNNILPQLDAEKGKIDFLICGTSQSVWGFIPKVMDEELGCDSFNVSSGLLSMEGRSTIIRSVMEDNPVKTLVMDFSFGNLLRDDDEDTIEGELLLEEHLYGTERLRYFFTHIQINELFSAFYYAMRTGLYSATHPGSDSGVSNPYYGKGFWGEHAATDQRKTIYWGTNQYDSTKSGTYHVNEKNLYFLDKIMQLCKEKNVCVYFVTTAYPTGVVSWSDRDAMLRTHLALARQYDCSLYDFNLLREKNVYFSDETSYYDVEHVSTEGAVTQTKLLAAWISEKSGGIGTDDRFYNSYAEVIEDYLQTVHDE